MDIITELLKLILLATAIFSWSWWMETLEINRRHGLNCDYLIHFYNFIVGIVGYFVLMVLQWNQ